VLPGEVQTDANQAQSETPVPGKATQRSPSPISSLLLPMLAIKESLIENDEFLGNGYLRQKVASQRALWLIEHQASSPSCATQMFHCHNLCCEPS